MSDSKFYVFGARRRRIRCHARTATQTAEARLQLRCWNQLPFEGIRIIERPTFGPDGVLASVELDIELPPSFPEKYREALVRVAEQCSVKRAIAAQPAFTVRAVKKGPHPLPKPPLVELRQRRA